MLVRKRRQKGLRVWNSALLLAVKGLIFCEVSIWSSNKFWFNNAQEIFLKNNILLFIYFAVFSYLRKMYAYLMISCKLTVGKVLNAGSLQVIVTKSTDLSLDHFLLYDEKKMMKKKSIYFVLNLNASHLCLIGSLQVLLK